jgi:hypothetical protein
MPIEMPPKPAIIIPRKPSIELTDKRVAWIFPAGGRRGAPASGVASRLLTATPTNVANAGSATATFSSVSCGTASGTSLVVVLAHCVKNGAANITFNSGAIDGTNGTIHANVTGNINLGTGSVATVYSRATTNSSITITAVYSITNWLGVMIEVYRLNDLTSATPHDTATASNAAGAGFNTDIDIPDNGILLQAVTIYSLSTSPTVTGTTQDRAETYQSAGRVYAGSDQEMSTESARSLTSTNGTTTGAMAAASWA